MKKLLGFLCVVLILFVAFARCNDNGTSEGPEKKKTARERILIQTNQTPLKVQYAALGIAAWVVVVAIGYGGHVYLNRKK